VSQRDPSLTLSVATCLLAVTTAVSPAVTLHANLPLGRDDRGGAITFLNTNLLDSRDGRVSSQSADPRLAEMSFEFGNAHLTSENSIPSMTQTNLGGLPVPSGEATIQASGMRFGVSAGRAPGAGGPTSVQCRQCQLKLLNTVRSRHGNAARLVWNDDGKTLFLANEEGTMSAVKIDASDPAAPRLVATNGDTNFLWAVAQKNGLLVFHTSIGADIIRINPQTFATVWKAQRGGTHALATDGSRIFVGYESARGSPGWLQILDSAGNTLQGVGVPEGWAGVDTTVYDASTRRVYVASDPDPSKNSPGASTSLTYRARLQHILVSCLPMILISQFQAIGCGERLVRVC